MTTIKQGLDLPILGSPEQHIEVARPVSRVALIGDDYVGMKPTMLVVPGDRVKQGQPLFEDKKNPGVLFTSPASGEVVAVNRGAKRRFESIEVAVDGDDRVEFDKARGADPVAMGRDGVTEQLVQSGLWTALRTRPFGKVPNPSNQPHSIFVQAIDTNPLAADPAVAMGQRKAQFTLGLQALTQLTGGKVFVCKADQSEIPGAGITGVQVEIIPRSASSRAGGHPHSFSRSGRAEQNRLVHRIPGRLCDRCTVPDRGLTPSA